MLDLDYNIKVHPITIFSDGRSIFYLITARMQAECYNFERDCCTLSNITEN